MSGHWIVIPRWDEFQHYKDREPLWIKTYTRLLHDDAYRDLTGHQRAVLHGLWLMYASSGCQVRLNTTSLTAQLGLRVSSRQLEVLIDAGFIGLSASKPLAPRYPRVEKELDLPNKVSTTKPVDNSNAVEQRVRTMIANGVIANAVDLEAELRAQAIDNELAEKLRGALKPL